MKNKEKNVIREKASELSLSISEDIEKLEEMISRNDECFELPYDDDGDDDYRLYICEIEHDMTKYGNFAKQLSKNIRSK